MNQPHQIREGVGSISRHPKGLAEIAVWYSIAVAVSAFLVLFLMAAISQIDGVNVALCFGGVLALWVTAIVGATWKLTRSSLVAAAPTSMAPLHILQLILCVFTVPHLFFATPGDWKMWSGILLVWEVWGVVFTFGFLVLAAVAKKRISSRTWVSSFVTILAVGYSVYQRL